MPRAALTPEQIDAFRARAVEAATRLFARNGYDAVTMRALASELGCSPMTPYRYFGGKEDLFAAVRTEAFRRFADAQQAALDAGQAPFDQLAALRDAYVGFALAEPDAYRTMFELSQPAPGSYPELDAEGLRAFSYLLQATEAAVAAGLLSGDALTLAHLMWGSMHGLVSLHLAGKLTLGRELTELTHAMLSQSKGSKL